MLLPVVCDLSVMVAVVTVSDSDVSVVNEDRIGESAAVIPVSDSDESGDEAVSLPCGVTIMIFIFQFAFLHLQLQGFSASTSPTIRQLGC